MENSENASATQLKKVRTYIKGLDDILEGGLPWNRTTIVNGKTGCGKSIFGLEFLYRGALHDEPGIFVGFEERDFQTRENAATLGMDFKALEKQNKLCIIEGHLDTDTILSGDFSLKGLLGIVSGKSKEMGAKRIVIDALDVILRLFDNPRKVRNELHLLNNWLRDSGLTVILTLRPSQSGISLFEVFFDSLSDCLINLDTRMEKQIATHRIRVVKYRGSSFGRNEYPYVITSEGIYVTPISSFGLRHKALGEHITTGNHDLDELLGGGFRRAACNLIAGLPGIGKTIMASTFTAAQCKLGEKVLYVGFEESEQAVIDNVKSAGIDLAPFIKNKTLQFSSSFPEEMGAEEHFILLQQKIETFNPRHIIIDAISATERMGGKQASYEYLMRTLNLAKAKGITTLFLNQLTGQKGFVEISGMDISSMVDTAIFLYYIEYPGETNRLVHILKSRGNKHSSQKREYVITDNGILFRDIYRGGNEVLTGTAKVMQEAKDKAELSLMTYQIKEKELELERLRLQQEQQLSDLNMLGKLHKKRSIIPNKIGNHNDNNRGD